MNQHDVFTAADGQAYDLVTDHLGRFVALIRQEDCKVMAYCYYPSTNGAVPQKVRKSRRQVRTAR